MVSGKRKAPLGVGVKSLTTYNPPSRNGYGTAKIYVRSSLPPPAGDTNIAPLRFNSPFRGWGKISVKSEYVSTGST